MDYYTSAGLIKCVDKYPVDSEASEVLPCPHCGKRPDLFVVSTEDEAVSNMLDTYWHGILPH